MNFTGFEWDRGNRNKCEKHGLSIPLIESIFDQPVTILPDERHSHAERRFRAIGQTSEGRFAFIVFTFVEPKSNSNPTDKCSLHVEHKSTAMKKPIPTFKTDEEAEEFVATADLSLRRTGDALRNEA